SSPLFFRQQGQQPKGNYPCNKPRESGNPLLWQFQLTDFFLGQFHKSIFVVEQFVAGRYPFPATLPTISCKHPWIRKSLPASHSCVHDLIDTVQLPAFWFLKGMSQRFLEQLFGTNLIPAVMLQKPLNLSGFGVLRHEIPLYLYQPVLYLLGKLHGILPAAVNHHSLCPNL